MSDSENSRDVTASGYPRDTGSDVPALARGKIGELAGGKRGEPSGDADHESKRPKENHAHEPARDGFAHRQRGVKCAPIDDWDLGVQEDLRDPGDEDHD